MYAKKKNVLEYCDENSKIVLSPSDVSDIIQYMYHFPQQPNRVRSLVIITPPPHGMDLQPPGVGFSQVTLLVTG